MYIPGLFVPLMDNDSAHHANIALQMYLDGNYTQLLDQGKPYLDKPHLLFWTAALSYHVFGVTAFAYKLPSFLFTLLGTYSTYRLGSLLYDKDTGRLAALIISTAFAYMLANNDVRMDAMLTGSIIFTLWQLCAYTQRMRLLHLVLAALGLGLGFATKGMIGVAVPGIAFLLYLIYARNWRMIFHWKWLVLVLLFFVFASPVLFAYYQQFDLHPEVEVRGKTQLSGVRFILWDQNFERMQGEAFGGEGETEYAYFLHTFLWAFLPWSILTVLALFSRIKQLVESRLRYQPGLEMLTVGGILFFMLLFSLSKFKLPHYLNVLLPLYALLLASYLHERRNKSVQVKLY
ncbi:MAG: glycosyltransferase family 39 protein, partial [Hymenobacteraceae bacterium]|nr:glycosyltransferase family 39 protein [Hymenobacteraceae bacterium]